MKELFTYTFDCGVKFDAKAYLDSLKAATKEGKLYIARKFDYVDGLYYEIAETEEAMNCVSVAILDWSKCDVDSFLGLYDRLLQEIEKSKEAESFDVAPYCVGELRFANVENRVNRLRALYKLGAPQMIVENEKHALLEELVFNYFGESYQDIILVEGENPPAKGSRTDLANKRVVARFIDVYEDVQTYVKKKGGVVSTVDIQKEFKVGYSFARYLLEQLEANNCLDGGKDKLKINATPYDNDTKFLDEMSEDELLLAINDIEKRGK